MAWHNLRSQIDLGNIQIFSSCLMHYAKTGSQRVNRCFRSTSFQWSGNLVPFNFPMSCYPPFLGGRGGQCVRLTTYQHPVLLSQNLGTLTSQNPLGSSGPVMGLLFLFTFTCYPPWLYLVTFSQLLQEEMAIPNQTES